MVATVPSVAHAHMVATLHMSWAEVVATVLVEAAAAVCPPAVPTTVGSIEVGRAKVEVVAARIAGVDAEVPVASLPVERTEEIGGSAEGIPLPAVEDIAQVLVATLPPDAVHVVIATDAHQVVQVNLVGCLVLRVGEVQLVGHLVGEEQGLVAGLLIGHGVGAQCQRQHGHQGENHLLHSRIVFRGLVEFTIYRFTIYDLSLMRFVIFHDAKERLFSHTPKGFSLNSRGKIPIMKQVSYKTPTIREMILS